MNYIVGAAGWRVNRLDKPGSTGMCTWSQLPSPAPTRTQLINSQSQQLPSWSLAHLNSLTSAVPSLAVLFIFVRVWPLGIKFEEIMDRFRINRRVQIEDNSRSEPPQRDYVDDSDGNSPQGRDDDDAEPEGMLRLTPNISNVSEDQEPFMGVKVRRKSSLRRYAKGDYIDVPSNPFLMKILKKQGFCRFWLVNFWVS